MDVCEYTMKREGEKNIMIVNCRNCTYGASIADYPACMARTVEKLIKEPETNMIVFAEAYEKIYDEEQTKLLKEIAKVADNLTKDEVWSLAKLTVPEAKDDKEISDRYNVIIDVYNAVKSDPVRAYFTTLEELKKETMKSGSLQGAPAAGIKRYIETLASVKTYLEATTLIRKVIEYVHEEAMVPKGREIYHTFFETSIKPAFISSRVLTGIEEEMELVDAYKVLGADVQIFRHPSRISYVYHISPPEYNLSPDKYFILTKTREIVAKQRPAGYVQFRSPEETRRYFERLYETTIRDLSKQYKVSMDRKEAEELAKVVARYTVGYGVLELLLYDNKVTDIYLDAPLGTKPFYLVHQEYGQCDTNIIFTNEEAKVLVSRFRSISGRPFDESHPVLDLDLPQINSRICVIGEPLSPYGTAFAFRRHKDTPWTLPQFIDNKMLNPMAAGMLSFFCTNQASLLISGSRGAGKSSLMSAMMLELLQNVRILCQEDTLEVPVPQINELGFNIQRLKTRSPIAAATTETEVSPEDSIRTALRLGDSVLVIGEVRSTEALTLYEAMRIGAVGNVVMGTIHGESAYGVWDRVVNDLKVPTTSFKATDFVMQCIPIRFKGSLKRNRRLVDITEVGKDWYTDPKREGGLLQLMDYDIGKDELLLDEEAMGKSEYFKKVVKRTGLRLEDIMEEITARAKAKKYLVDVKNKFSIPQLLEATYTVPSNNKYLLLEQRQREETGAVNHEALLNEWRAWVDAAQIKPLISKSVH